MAGTGASRCPKERFCVGLGLSTPSLSLLQPSLLKQQYSIGMEREGQQRAVYTVSDYPHLPKRASQVVAGRVQCRELLLVLGVPGILRPQLGLQPLALHLLLGHRPGPALLRLPAGQGVGPFQRESIA
eukprot:SAG22_NODE_655_length_8104_cov_6.498438_10_plen_128_part_00